MIISKEIPPIFDRIKKQFKVNWDAGICIAYGDTVYSKNELPLDVEVHEQIHLDQQKEIGVEKWWDMYLTNKNFRLNQEIEAYKEQVACLQNRGLIFTREYKRWKLNQIPKDLSGPIYGNMIKYKEAKKILGL